MTRLAVATLLVLSVGLTGGRAMARCPDGVDPTSIRLAAPLPGEGYGRGIATDGVHLVRMSVWEVSPGLGQWQVRVFRREAGDWSEQALLDMPADLDMFQIRPGISIDVDGDLIAVGSTASSASELARVDLWRLTGDTWEHEATVHPPDRDFGGDFGSSVGVSGDLLVVGDPGGGVAGDYRGRAAVFRHSLMGWEWTARITADDFPNLWELGASVAASGGRIAVSTGQAPWTVIYRVEVCGLEREARLSVPPGTLGRSEIESIAFDGERLVIGMPAINTAFSYGRCDTEWQLESELAAPDLGPDARFGESVALSGDVVAIGAPDDGPFELGKVHLFNKAGASWVRHAALERPVASTLSNFGTHVGLGPTEVVATGDSNSSEQEGSLSWTECGEPDCEDAIDEDGDGDVDCADAACAVMPECFGSDFDSDGVVNGLDCAPLDAAAHSLAPEVPWLRVRRGTSTDQALFTWADVDSANGTRTTYEIFGERLCSLRDGGVAAGEVLDEGLLGTAWADESELFGDGLWFLVRARTCCGPQGGTGWGSDSSGQLREACR